MIEAAGLTKRFGTAVAASGVSLRALDGRITALLGPNGAGKSTTLRILYEPTNGLDVMAVRTSRRLLQHLRAAGHCILFSSHVMQEIGALCDDVVIIAQGRVVAQGTPQELQASAGTQSLEEAFVRLVGVAEGLEPEGASP